jgi:Zn-dependent protease with chaperone function
MEQAARAETRFIHLLRRTDGSRIMRIILRGPRRLWPACVAGLIVTYAGLWLLPLIVAAGVLGGLAGGIAHMGYEAVNGHSASPTDLLIGPVLGAGTGAVALMAEATSPLGLIRACIPGLVISLITVGTIARFERPLLSLRGARRMSRREEAQLVPLAREAARGLGLTQPPQLLMIDSPNPNAYCHLEYVIVARGLLTQMDDEQITGILAHEFAHWKAGDAAGLRWAWACSLPLSLAYDLGCWVSQRVPLGGFIWLFLWPIAAIERFVLVPLIGVNVRQQEYDADRAADRAGHAFGLYRALEHLQMFEGGRSGWEDAVSATHPPIELRLEGLEG